MTSGGAVTVKDAGTASFTVDPDDPVFPGHYPGYPVLPGVYLIGFADRAVRARLADGPAVRFAAVERCRFLAPVYPGDEVAFDLTTEDTGEGVRCTAKAATRRGPAADLVLSYRREAAG